jgi:Raf kinase inhibitor-like YbhB/YbcL family protein
VLSITTVPKSSGHFPVFRFPWTAGIWITLVANVTFAQSITLESPAFRLGQAIPKRYAAEGKSYSPPLVWTNLPEATRELALVFEDVEESKVYWLVYRISVKATKLPENLPRNEVLTDPPKLAGMIQGLTDFKQAGPGYVAPDRVSGKEHRYRFTLYALDAQMGLLPGLDKDSLMVLIQNHIIGKGELPVKYGGQ